MKEREKNEGSGAQHRITSLRGLGGDGSRFRYIESLRDGGRKDLFTPSLNHMGEDYPEERPIAHIKKFLPSDLDLEKRTALSLEEIAARLGTAGTPREKGADAFTVSGNASFHEAEVVYLCEAKHSFGNHVTIVEYLRGVVKSGDTVLAEGFPAGRIVDREEADVFAKLPADVSIIGWDNMDLHRKATELYDELDGINHELEGTEVPEEEKVYRRIYMTGDLVPRIHQTAILDRNESLRETIGTVRRDKPDNKTYVIAGSNHMEKDQQMTEFSEQFSYAVMTLE